MEKIICDMCGSNDVTLNNDNYICNVCGTRFKLREKYQSYINTPFSRNEVFISDNLSVDELIIESKNALNSNLSGNQEAALQYCKKAFSIEPSNFDVLKQYAEVLLSASSLSDYLLLTKLKTLLERVSECKKGELLQIIQETLNRRLYQMFLEKCTGFDWYSGEREIINALEKTINTQNEFSANLGFVFNNSYDNYLSSIYDVANNEWKHVITKYNTAPENKPDSILFNDLLTVGNQCENLLTVALSKIGKSDISEVKFYELLINILRTQNNACSWKTELKKTTSIIDGMPTLKKVWVKEYVTSDEKQRSNKEKIELYSAKIKEISPSQSTKVTPDDIAKELLSAGYYNKKLEAIKILGERTGLKLGEASQVIERVFSNSGYGIDKSDTKSGCYIATCVYGSYDCPQVWTLRRYRDDTLASSWYGRVFIRTYYAISPTFVKWFGNTKWFKKMWENKLDNMVSKLRDNGVEDTPYQDKDWR